MPADRTTWRAEERRVAEVIEEWFEDVTVELHDDGTEPSMYDLDLFGRLRAAVEVVQITNSEVRIASAHVDRLGTITTDRLTHRWHFIHAELVDFGDAAHQRFPHLPRPDVERLTSVLERFEARELHRIGFIQEWIRFGPNGFHIEDDDVRELVNLVGAAADFAVSYPVGQDEPGGWTFDLSYGNTSHVDPNRFADDIRNHLHSERFTDVRSKLAASKVQNRIAAIVLDSTTSEGWATGHFGTDNQTPTATIDLPHEITHVLVVGMNAHFLYSDDRWERIWAAGY